MAARKPDFNLSAKPKDGQPGCKVGAGWKNDDGSISIKLNVGTTLSWNDDLFLGLFPTDGEWRPAKKRGPAPDPGDHDERNPILEEPPF